MAREILRLDWPRQARWEALVLVSVLSVVAAQILQIMSGNFTTMSIFGTEVTMAIGLGLAQLVIMVIGAYAAAIFGKLAGGTGDLDGAILLLAWLQAVLLAFQLAQILAVFLLPFLSGPLGLVAFVLSFWLMTVFVAELHGFRSLGMVLVGILMTMVLIGIAVSMLLSLLGLQISMGMV